MSITHQFVHFILLLTLSTAIGCSGGADVQVDGSSTVYPITARVAENLRYEGHYIRVTVARSGTGGGMKKFSNGEIDICDASREMKSGEAEACAEAGIEFENFMVSYDGIAVCVHPDNDWCDGLTVEQLKQIFVLDSTVEKWSDLNPDWPDKKISIFGPGTDSGTYDSFNENVLGKKAKVRIGYTQSEEDNVLVNGVSTGEYALGYFGFGYYVENADVLKVVGIDGGSGEFVVPTVETIRDKTYTPLSRPLFIYVNLASFRNEKVADFVEFYLDHAAEASKEERYVPVPDEIHEENLLKFKKLQAALAK